MRPLSCLCLSLSLLMSLSWPLRAVASDEFPTLERVDNVLTCMKKHGGQTLNNMYFCSCAQDIIASKISYDEWVEAKTFAAYRRMPGERGGVFRDSEKGKTMIKKLEVVEEEAERRCFVGVNRPSKDN